MQYAVDKVLLKLNTHLEVFSLNSPQIFLLNQTSAFGSFINGFAFLLLVLCLLCLGNYEVRARKLYGLSGWRNWTKNKPQREELQLNNMGKILYGIKLYAGTVKTNGQVDITANGYR